MGTIASRMTSRTVVYSSVYSGADQRKHQSSASLAFVRGIHGDFFAINATCLQQHIRAQIQWPTHNDKAFFILMHKINQVMASLMCSLKRLNKTKNITIVCILYDAISNIQISLEIIHWTNMQNILSASAKESGNKQITCPLYFIFRGEKGANNNFVRCPILHQQGGWYMFSYFKSKIAVIVQRLE